MSGVFRFRRGASEANTPDQLAALMQDTGSAEAAMGLLVGGLSPEQRAALAGQLLPALPPLMRARVLGDSFTAADWERLRNSMEAAERRDHIVQGLIDVGRQTRTIDLAAIPPETSVDLELFQREGPVPDPLLTIPIVERRPALGLRLRSLGEGLFVADETVYIYRATSAESPELPSYQHRPHRAFSLGNLDHKGEYRSVVRHGRPLATLVEGAPVEFTSFEHTPRSYQLHECYLANLALDRRQAFCYLPD